MCGPSLRSGGKLLCWLFLSLLLTLPVLSHAEVVLTDEEYQAVLDQVTVMEQTIERLDELLSEEINAHAETRKQLESQIEDTNRALSLYDAERTLRLVREKSLRERNVALAVESGALAATLGLLIWQWVR